MLGYVSYIEDKLMIMKGKILIFLFAFFTAFMVSAQFEIKSNVLGLVNNNYNGQLELLLNRKSGIELEASYRNTPWVVGLAGSEIKNNAFRILISYKYYWAGDDPTSGLYLSPYVRLKVANMENIPTILSEDYTGTVSNPEQVKILANALTLGLTGGQKITIGSNVIIEYYAGLGYNPVNQNRIRDNLPQEIEEYVLIETNSFTWPWDFRLGLSIGYRFWR